MSLSSSSQWLKTYIGFPNGTLGAFSSALKHWLKAHARPAVKSYLAKSATVYVKVCIGSFIRLQMKSYASRW